MTEERFKIKPSYDGIHLIDNKYTTFYPVNDTLNNVDLFCERLNILDKLVNVQEQQLEKQHSIIEEQDKRIIKLEKELKDCKKLKKKRLRKIKHQRVVLDELGAAIMGYRGEIKKLKAQINK